MGSIGERIEEIMKKKQISKYKLAKASGVPYTTLVQIISGRTKSPQIDSLRAIANYLDVDIDNLIEEGDYDGPKSSVEEDFENELFDEETWMIAREYQNLSPESKEFLKKILEKLD